MCSRKHTLHQPSGPDSIRHAQAVHSSLMSHPRSQLPAATAVMLHVTSSLIAVDLGVTSHWRLIEGGATTIIPLHSQVPVAVVSSQLCVLGPRNVISSAAAQRLRIIQRLGRG